MEIIAIANPVGGSFNKNTFAKCINILERKIGKIDVCYTEYAGHGKKISSEINADLVISAGGDGIINEVVNGLAGKKCLFFPLPFGTANVFCKEHNISANPIKAAENLNIKSVEEIYLGFINNRYFVQMIGFGFDADAVKNVDLNFKKKFGKLAYIKSGFEILLRGNFQQITFFHKGQRRISYHLIVSVGKKYAGQFQLVKNKSKDKFSVCYLDSNSRLALFKAIFSMLLNLGFGKNTFEATSIKVGGVSHCQIDGDFFELEDGSQHIIAIKKADFLLVN